MLFGGRPKEAEVLRAVREYLTAKGVFGWRNNSGAYADAKSGRFIRYGALGTSDLLCIYPHGEKRGCLWGIEVKRPGGLLSDGQITFLRALRVRGAVALVAESVEDVEKCLANPEYMGAERYARLLSTP